MKKIIASTAAAIVLGLALTACGLGNGSDENQVLGTFKRFESSEFALSYPSQWEVLTEKDFPGNVPEGSAVAFRSNVKNAVFTPNITVVTMAASATASSSDFVKGLSQKHAARLVSYKEIGREEAALKKNGEDIASLIVIFEGKRAENEDLKRFYQTALVDDKTAHVVTAAALAKESEALEDDIIESLSSFELQ